MERSAGVAGGRRAPTAAPARVLGAALAAILVVALVLAGCQGGDGGGGETVEVLHPPADAVVTLPFEVTLEASVPLGSPDGEWHHVHIWFGDDDDAYLVVESETVQVVSAPIGAHEMHVSLRMPDHDPAGFETSIPIVITSGTG